MVGSCRGGRGKKLGVRGLSSATRGEVVERGPLEVREEEGVPWSLGSLAGTSTKEMASVDR